MNLKGEKEWMGRYDRERGGGRSGKRRRWKLLFSTRRVISGLSFHFRRSKTKHGKLPAASEVIFVNIYGDVMMGNTHHWSMNRSTENKFMGPGTCAYPNILMS